MPEAAVATPAPPPAPAAPAASPPPTPSAGEAMAPAAPPAWFNDFKNAEIKQYVQTKNFANPEKLAESYHKLEKFIGADESKLIKLPEKMEGDEARAIWERLGAPKEAKGYEVPRPEGGDPKFAEWAEGTFHKNSLTKTQAQGVLNAYNEFAQSQMQAQQTAVQNARLQADVKLKGEWGAQYETNVGLAKQGAKILGLDVKALDIMEAVQGREALFKKLQQIGVSMAESNFVDGNAAAATSPSVEEAQAKVKELTQDKAFGAKVLARDSEALKEWNKWNQLAAPGHKAIG